MRVLVCLVVLYLLADFCDAGLRGAFNFSADESVEVVRAATPKPPTNPLRMATPEPRANDVRPAVDTRVPNANLVVSAMTVASHSPTIPLRPRIRHLSSEECPAASPAV